jgi:hypothetical protein
MKTELPPIHSIRRQRVMLDSDLARLYGVPTSRLNEAVKRNVDRFPADFRFQLTPVEYTRLISQFAISNVDITDNQSDTNNSSQSVMSPREGRGGLRKLPWAFTEHGALMAATVLSSSRAVQMSLFVVRAFVQMREELQAHATGFKRLADGVRQHRDGVARRSRTARRQCLRVNHSGARGRNGSQIDKKLVTHDVILRDVYEKLRPLLNPPVIPRKELGFHTHLKKPKH